MANWVKGKLKIRGKPEDIKRWVEECLHCYFTKWFRDGSYEDELVDDAVVFEHDPKAREMRLDSDRGRLYRRNENETDLLKRGSTGFLQRR